MIIKLRKWLIRKLAGRMGVVLNASIVNDPVKGPGICYAGNYGGMCELSGVK